MATRGFDIGESWVEVTDFAGLNMSNDTTYVVEMQGDSTKTVVLAHDNQANNAPADDADGHIWFLRSSKVVRETAGTIKEFTKKSGWYWWLRTSRGEARVVATEI